MDRAHGDAHGEWIVPPSSSQAKLLGIAPCPDTQMAELLSGLWLAPGHVINVQFGISTLDVNGDSAQLALQVWGGVGICRGR